ncbi:hypothetical protein ACJX0J_024394, partial [Zea mays]
VPLLMFHIEDDMRTQKLQLTCLFWVANISLHLVNYNIDIDNKNNILSIVVEVLLTLIHIIEPDGLSLGV